METGGAHSLTGDPVWVDIDSLKIDTLFARVPEARKSELSRTLRDFYQARNSQLAWLRKDRVVARRELLEALSRADRHGFERRSPEDLDYRIRLWETQGDESGAMTELDAELTIAYFEHAASLAHGVSVAPLQDPDWHYEQRKIDFAAHLASALEEDRVLESLEDLAPRSEDYLALLKLLSKYQRLAAAGGFPEISAGPVLTVGDESGVDRLQVLTTRLMLGGDLADDEGMRLKRQWGDATRATYDETLSAAVADYQRRHGLEGDGKLGPDTIAALNESVEERIQTIRINLERWRWLPQPPEDRYIRVNITDQRLRAFDDGEMVLTMKVAVGRADWPTPVFEDTMDQIVVNPNWNVPHSIATDEVLVKAEEDPDYLSRKRFVILDEQGDVVETNDKNLRAVAEGKYRMRQLPGASNALGRIKFLFPNRFSVYLHDTPAQSAFERDVRAVSHGCLRVAEPLELARYVLGNDGARQVEDLWNEGQREHLRLEEPLPVRIRYMTAFVEDGRAYFPRDLYDHDADLRDVFPLTSPPS